MALFNFKCTNCDKEFDKFLSITDYKLPESEPCPSCGEIKVQKVISSPTMFQFDKHIKTDDSFKDLLKQIGKNNKGSTVNQNFGES